MPGEIEIDNHQRRKSEGTAFGQLQTACSSSHITQQDIIKQDIISTYIAWQLPLSIMAESPFPFLIWHGGTAIAFCAALDSAKGPKHGEIVIPCIQYGALYGLWPYYIWRIMRR